MCTLLYCLHMDRFKRYGKIILFDTLAVLCFIGVILFGWIPGPGGIPLFLLGLGLLAVNHDWAERWLETAKHKGVSFKQWLFPDKVWVKNLYDAGSILLILTGGYMFYRYTYMFQNEPTGVPEPTNEVFFASGAIVLFCMGLFIFLLNRDRFGTFAKLFKKNK